MNNEARDKARNKAIRNAYQRTHNAAFKGDGGIIAMDKQFGAIFDEGYEAGRASTWVSVEDEGLPKFTQHVLGNVPTLNGPAIVDKLLYQKDTNIFYSAYSKTKYGLEEVTHWQPLPPPADGGEK